MDARDEIVCKRFIATGSLVKGYRTCKAKWERERERENLRNLDPKASCGSQSGLCRAAPSLLRADPGAPSRA